MKIKIYKTTTCPFCPDFVPAYSEITKSRIHDFSRPRGRRKNRDKMEAEYLYSKGIQFEEIYVDKNPKAVQEMIAESGQMSVPFTVITKGDGSKISILGFDKQKLDSALVE